MQHNYPARLGLIAVIFIVFTIAIVPNPMKLFDPEVPLGKALNLRPGIDMIGGTSLIYEIQVPEGMEGNTRIAEDVMMALRRRVDPNGLRNLIWRPQGTRLEIQMPRSADTDQVEVRQREYATARDALEVFNVRRGTLLRALRMDAGAARDTELARLAGQSPTRQRLIQELSKLYADRAVSERDADFRALARIDQQLDDLKNQFDQTNIPTALLEANLDATDQGRDQRLAQLRQRCADNPEQLKAFDAFQTAYQAFTRIRGALDSTADLKRLLQGSGVLEFFILVSSDELGGPEAQRMIERLMSKGPASEAGDRMRWFQVDRPDQFKGQDVFTHNDKTYALGWTTPERSLTKASGEWALTSATRTTDQRGVGAVGFGFDAGGAMLFGKLTATNIGRPLAIVLDGKLISAPNINSQITSSGIITGEFSAAELRYLINTLAAGSLPAQLASEPISERTVGPSLGSDNLRRGLLAAIAGLVLVTIIMIAYYWVGGLIATFCLVMNLVLILGVMASFNATFTLPSIAGIVLTIGSSVDANVLIFERLREEMRRGLSFKMSVHNAYSKAFSAILDANVTTSLTALVLYGLGTEEVKGFGLTLLIGIISSLFTALFVSRTIIGVLTERCGMQRITMLPSAFPKFDKLLRPNIDWVAMAPYAITGSAIFAVIGMTLFVTKAGSGELMDVEFTSGTSVQFQLKEPMAQQAVRDIIEKIGNAVPSPTVVAVGEDDTQYEVVTPNPDMVAVKDAILEVLTGRLRLEEPSSYDHMALSAAEAVNRAIIPILRENQQIGGFVPTAAASHVRGAAIVLQNLDPPLSAREVRQRITRQRLQATAAEALLLNRDFEVESDHGPDEPATTVVVLVSDPGLPFTADREKWLSDLAGPMWRLVGEAVNKPASLQKVSKFDASVASDSRMAAILAVVASLIIIMGYIWFRFGNMRYAVATLTALVHDIVMALAALGVSHYVAGTLVGDALLLSPFRINMVIIAALLTMASYSMMDTIVIFDRVRENRGKFGVLSKTIINDSINQVLSRTLMTSLTTLASIMVMYIVGGSGTQGFAFIMTFGIIVGTYSTVAIAAPMLLLGRQGTGQPGQSS